MASVGRRFRARGQRAGREKVPLFWSFFPVRRALPPGNHFGRWRGPEVGDSERVPFGKRQRPAVDELDRLAELGKICCGEGEPRRNCETGKGSDGARQVESRVRIE